MLAPSPGPLSAADQDAGIAAPVRYSLGGAAAALLRLHPDSGALSATQDLLQRTRVDVTLVVKVGQGYVAYSPFLIKKNLN